VLVARNGHGFICDAACAATGLAIGFRPAKPDGRQTP